MNNAVSLEGLVKRYGKHRGIEGLDLKVKEGEWFGYIGPNGAGKSTTIRTMLGLIKATEGKSTVLGMDSWKDREKIMEKVGYLPSEAIFYPEMTVSETLDYALSLHGSKNKRRQKVLSERLELDTGRKIGELSYGNRKKVGIVCALEHNPSLLILDEPTGGLDPLMQREFFSMLEEEHRKGVTIFMSSHILSEISAICDRVIVICNGEIVADTKVNELSSAITGKSTLTVEVEGSTSAVTSAINTVSGVTKVSVERQNADNCNVYTVEHESGTDIRKGVFNVMAKNNMPILTMNEGGMSLEEAYLRLTSKNAIKGGKR